MKERRTLQSPWRWYLSRRTLGHSHSPAPWRRVPGKRARFLTQAQRYCPRNRNISRLHRTKHMVGKVVGAKKEHVRYYTYSRTVMAMLSV